MNCSSLNVSSQVSLQLDDDGQTLTGDFASRVANALGSVQEISVAPGAAAVPLGPVTTGQLAFLFVKNLDPALPLQLSLNANGSAPFAQLAGGGHAVIPTVPGTSYYFNNPGASALAVEVLAVSS